MTYYLVYGGPPNTVNQNPLANHLRAGLGDQQFISAHTSVYSNNALNNVEYCSIHTVNHSEIQLKFQDQLLSVDAKLFYPNDCLNLCDNLHMYVQPEDIVQCEYLPQRFIPKITKIEFAPAKFPNKNCCWGIVVACDANIAILWAPALHIKVELSLTSVASPLLWQSVLVGQRWIFEPHRTLSVEYRAANARFLDQGELTQAIGAACPQLQIPAVAAQHNLSVPLSVSLSSVPITSPSPPLDPSPLFTSSVSTRTNQICPPSSMAQSSNQPPPMLNHHPFALINYPLPMDMQKQTVSLGLPSLAPSVNSNWSNQTAPSVSSNLPPFPVMDNQNQYVFSVPAARCPVPALFNPMLPSCYPDQLDNHNNMYNFYARHSFPGTVADNSVVNSVQAPTSSTTTATTSIASFEVITGVNNQSVVLEGREYAGAGAGASTTTEPSHQRIVSTSTTPPQSTSTVVSCNSDDSSAAFNSHAQASFNIDQHQHETFTATTATSSFAESASNNTPVISMSVVNNSGSGVISLNSRSQEALVNNRSTAALRKNTLSVNNSSSSGSIGAGRVGSGGVDPCPSPNNGEHCGLVTAIRGDGCFIYTPTIAQLLFCYVEHLDGYYDPFERAAILNTMRDLRSFDAVYFRVKPNESVALERRARQPLLVSSIRVRGSDQEEEAEFSGFDQLKIVDADIFEFVRTAAVMRGRTQEDKAKLQDTEVYLKTSAFPSVIASVSQVTYVGQWLKLIVCEQKNWNNLNKRPWFGLTVLPATCCVQTIESFRQLSYDDRKKLFDGFAAHVDDISRQRRAGPGGPMRPPPSVQAGSATQRSSDSTSKLRNNLGALERGSSTSTRSSASTSNQQHFSFYGVVNATRGPTTSSASSRSSTAAPNRQAAAAGVVSEQRSAGIKGLVVAAGDSKGFVWSQDFGLLEFTANANTLSRPFASYYVLYSSVKFDVVFDDSANGTCETQAVDVYVETKPFLHLDKLGVVDGEVLALSGDAAVVLDSGFGRIFFDKEVTLLEPSTAAIKCHLPSKGQRVRVLVCRILKDSATSNCDWRALRDLTNSTIFNIESIAAKNNAYATGPAADSSSALKLKAGYVSAERHRIFTATFCAAPFPSTIPPPLERTLFTTQFPARH